VDYGSVMNRRESNGGFLAPKTGRNWSRKLPLDHPFSYA
jgi:hypothetical protein